MIRVAAQWELSVLLQRMRGRDGILILLVPVTLLAPLQLGGFFDSWLQGALILGWLYAFVLASLIGGNAGVAGAGAFWLFQKGISVVDFCLARLMFAASTVSACTIYAALWYAIGAAVRGEYEVRHHLAWTLSIVMAGVLALAVLYLLASAGSRRNADFLIVLGILALLRDVLFAALPAPFEQLITPLLPPFVEATSVVRALVAGTASAAVGDALHVLVYIVACVGVATVFHRRWRPVLTSSR